jgi:histidinol dehydrogenase
MKIYKIPTKDIFEQIVKRPVIDNKTILSQVNKILKDVRLYGDKAIRKYNEKFDKIPQSFSIEISIKERELSSDLISKELKQAIDVASVNIEKFHKSQLVYSDKVETTKGVYCWQKYVPIENVGLYIPGGTAPLLSTLMMLAIPAKIAGCKNIVVCTPPRSDGSIDPTILYLLNKFKIKNAFKIGGAQAIGAMAFGTKTIPKIDKIFGPGNQYVTAAKQIVSIENIAIDMPAGPSEVAIIADDTANPEFVAADFLSQLEHGPDSQAIIVTSSEKLCNRIQDEIIKQLPNLTRKLIIEKSIIHSSIIILEKNNEILDFINTYAPEHLIISTKENEYFLDNIMNAGSVFIGNYTPESAGDYASGTNHTLPTNGASKAYSGLSTLSFMKKITFQEITKEGILNLGNTIEQLAEAEQLAAHKNAVTVRLKSLQL